MKNKVTLFLVLALMLTACTDPFMNTPFIDKTNENISLSNAEYLQKYNDKFSLWIEFLKYADLYNALNDAANTSTLFAPDNNAVEKFLQLKGVNSIQELDKEYAKYVAQVHILKGTLQETVFIQNVENGSIPIKTQFDSYLTTSFGFRNTDVDDEFLNGAVLQDSLSIYLNNQAKVADLGRADITANGIVYTMNDVILPLSETIVEKLRNYGEYNIFIQAVEKTGYDKVVSVYADTVLNLDGSISITDVRFTCFGVPDEAYNKAGIQSIEGLISYINAGSDYESPQNALYQYVAYHFMGQAIQKATLSDFDNEGEVKIFDTKLAGNVITVQSKNGILKINDTATFVRSNIKARNGIIHKIDNILAVTVPKPLSVIWDFCNSADIESFVNSYGAFKSIGELFSLPLNSKEYQIDLSDDMRDGNFGTINSFEYMANASKTPTQSWRKVGFFKCSYVSAADFLNNKYGAYMDNLFILNLGYAGNITLKTPTIIKGKYRVKIYYAGAPGLRTYYTNGSNTRFNLDDYQKSIYMWKGIPATFVDPARQTDLNANGIASEVLWNEVTFDASGTHTFKATMMDINAKTSTSYRQMWDYLEFEPIE